MNRAPYAGNRLCDENAGVGVGLPDWGRCCWCRIKWYEFMRRLPVSVGDLERFDTGGFADRSNSVEQQIWYCPANINSPDSGDDIRFEQTLITEEAAKRYVKSVKIHYIHSGVKEKNTGE